MILRVVLAVFALLVLVPQMALGQAPACPADTVSREVLAEEMRGVVNAQPEFDLLATTNWPRLQSALFLRLVRRAIERGSDRGLLLIPAKSLFWETVSLAGLEVAEADQAPPHLLWALHLDQATRLEYRPDSIVREIKQGSHPELAINVGISWPDREDGMDKYSFFDTLAVPKLRVTNRQLVSFRLLDLGDMVAYDKISGVSGRPTSGVLGALFKLLGEGDVKYSRLGLASDGLLVVRAQAKKIFSKTVTVTIHPDGVVEKDVPEGRPDLERIEARLKEDLEIEYFPYRCW